MPGDDRRSGQRQPFPPRPAEQMSDRSAGWGGGFSVPVQVPGFVPYPGMSSQPGGHACLSPIVTAATACRTSHNRRPSDKLDHRRLCRCRVRPMRACRAGRSPRRLSFPFNAVAAVRKGEEKVILEIESVSVDKALTKDDLSFLRKGRYRDLRLHPSTTPLKAFAIEGGHGGRRRAFRWSSMPDTPFP